MDPALVASVIAELAPHGLQEVIPTTMGEPLMYKHFDVFVSACAQHDVKLNLTTNGSFFGPGVDAWAAKLLPVLSDVKISWNGSNAAVQEAIMKGTSFDRMLSNLRRLVAAGDALAAAGGNRASITLQATFMEANVGDLPNLVRLAAMAGADRVKGHQLWEHWGAAPGAPRSLRRSPDAAARWNAAARLCREAAASTPRSRGPAGGGAPFLALAGFEDLPVGVESPAAPPPEAECPFLGRELWVAADGSLAPCCAPADERKALGGFGSAAEPGGALRACGATPTRGWLPRTRGIHFARSARCAGFRRDAAADGAVSELWTLDCVSEQKVWIQWADRLAPWIVLRQQVCVHKDLALTLVLTTNRPAGQQGYRAGR